MARTRVQSIRSNVTGARPASQEPGIVFTNFADRQIGVVDPARQPLDLVGIRFFSTTAAYAAGAFVVNANKIWRAKAAVPAGNFNYAQWDEVGTDRAIAYVGDNPAVTGPAEPRPGELWWESDTGSLYIWYDDGDSRQWVEVKGGSNAGAAGAAQRIVTPMDFNAAGNGVVDDSNAVEAALNDGRPLDWLDRTYRITRPMLPAIAADVSWRSRGARIVYDGAIAQRVLYLDLAGKNFGSTGKLTVNANLKAYAGLHLYNNTDTVADVLVEDLGVSNVYRAGTAFAAGDGILVEGNFERVDLVRSTVRNVRMAAGAGTAGVQGVRGICVKASSSVPFRAARQVNVIDADIDTVQSEDLAYTSDQDGLVIFTAEDSGILKPYETKAFVRGGRFRNCFGRSIKLQVDYASVQGSHFIRTTGFTGSPGAEIDSQTTGASITDVSCLYDAGTTTLPTYVIILGTAATAGKSVPYGIVRGLQVQNQGTAILSTLVYVSFRTDPNSAVIDGISMRGPVDRIVRVTGPSGSTQQNAVISNVMTTRPNSTLVHVQGSGFGGVIALSDCINTGADTPLLTRNDVTNPTEWVTSGAMVGWTQALERTLTVATDAITVGVMNAYMLDTEAAAATDDLSTITGGKVINQLVALRAVNSARTIVVKNGVGNIRLAGSDFSLTHSYDLLVLRYTFGDQWVEQSRSDNAA